MPVDRPAWGRVSPSQPRSIGTAASTTSCSTTTCTSRSRTRWSIPSTLERQKFYGVRSSPSYFIDGDRDGGGGSADVAKSLYERKVEPVVEKHLADAPEAAIKLRATRSGSTVKVRASVSNVKSKSDKLRLQIALVEDLVRYSGENGNRFHDMVVRSLAAAPPAPSRPAAKPAPPKASPAGNSPLRLRPRRTKPAAAAPPAGRQAGRRTSRPAGAAPRVSRCGRARAATSSTRSTWRRRRPTRRRTWRTSRPTPARARTRSGRRSTRSTPASCRWSPSCRTRRPRRSCRRST